MALSLLFYRVLRPLRSAQGKQMHSLMQGELQQEGMKIITTAIMVMVIMVITVITVIMAMMAMMVIMIIMAIMELLMALMMDKVNKVLDHKNLTNLMARYFKASII